MQGTIKEHDVIVRWARFRNTVMKVWGSFQTLEARSMKFDVQGRPDHSAVLFSFGMTTWNDRILKHASMCMTRVIVSTHIVAWPMFCSTQRFPRRR